MKINGNEIRPGNVITHKDGLWVAVKTQAVKPKRERILKICEINTK